MSDANTGEIPCGGPIDRFHPTLAVAVARASWFEGIVVRGRQLGRTLGFPTANLLLDTDLAPANGVYAALVALEDGRWFSGVANVGVSPTIEGATPLRLEVSLFDFDEDIYGDTIRVGLLDFLRSERKFDGLTALCAQLVRDGREAKSRLAGIVLR